MRARRRDLCQNIMIKPAQWPRRSSWWATAGPSSLCDLLNEGARRFQDFQTSLKGIAPSILSDRLKLMEEHGLIARRFYSEHPPRAEYILTDKGKELGTVVGALAVWGSRHVHHETVLVHTDCGQPVQVGYYCPHCGDRV